MTALSHACTLPDPATEPMPELLNKLRFLSMACRVSPRMDLFQACRLIDPDPHLAADAYATALIRTFSQALGRGPSIRMPGAEPSFDELWLMRLIERSKAKDNDSLAFLLIRRIPVDRRHAFLHLINGLARSLEKI